MPSHSLRSLPAVHAVLEHPAVRPLIEAHGRGQVVGWIRRELEAIRKENQNGKPAPEPTIRLVDETGEERDAGDDLPPTVAGTLADDVAERVVARADSADRARLGRVINATGVILHTGLGRAPLSAAAVTAVSEAGGAVNLELDLETGRRRHRGYQLEAVWQTLTGCEDALFVNNNAAATLLTLQALCAGREVVISRGQLIEIGGSFRLPDIFALSRAVLKEVGTTNRTRLQDYADAIGPETAAVMHVHPSNYKVVGFTESPPIGDLVKLAQERDVLCIDDVGSGSLVDVTRFGLPAEPTFPDSLAAGADVVLGSGDKLLGGPQAGIILGRREHVARLREHPLARAVRIDKLTLAALSATLDAYLRETAETEIPTLQLLSTPVAELAARAEAVRTEIGDAPGWQVDVQTETAPVGGGALPGAELPTAVLSLFHDRFSAEEIARRLRLGTIRVLARVRNDRVLLDLRSIASDDDTRLALAVRLLASHA